MAVYRNISLSFWTDTKVEDSFTPEDKYMYLYLLTNPHTNICGCYEISTKQISRQTGYNAESVERILERMECTHKVIKYSKETNELLIFNWCRYNWTTSEKLVKPITTAINAIKFKPFRDYVSLLFEHIEEIHTVSIPYPYGMDTTVSVSVTDTVSDIKPIKDKKHRYGEYQNVLLSDTDLEKLKAEFPDWESRIENLSVYMKSKGATYKDHLATIRAWARKENNERGNHTGNDSRANKSRFADISNPF
jgi:hypothetical protein